MYIVERKALIMEKLRKDNVVSVAQLADLLNISRETVRRDLRELEKDGLVHRTHGGAVCEPQSNGVAEHPFTVREVQHHAEKVSICECAAKYIQDGDTIFVDNSSTTVNLLRFINPRAQVTVITNSIQQLFEFSKLQNHNLTIISLGGVFRAKNFSLTGSLAVESARGFRPSKAFISCRAIEPSGFSEGSIYEVETKRALIGASKEVFVLADHSKFLESGTVFLAELHAATRVITDSLVDSGTVRMLEAAGVEVVTVPEPSAADE